jgi:AcrR family transcriptional regulator
MYRFQKRRPTNAIFDWASQIFHVHRARLSKGEHLTILKEATFDMAKIPMKFGAHESTIETPLTTVQTHVDRGDTRERLHRIALDLFLKNGYESTTTRDLATALGVQQPSLYNHIRNKEELLRGICYPSFLQLIETAEAGVSQAHTPLEKLLRLARAHLTVTLAYQKEFSVSVMECRSLSEGYRAEIDGLWKRYQAFIYAILDETKAAKIVRSDVDNRYLYTALMDMLNWSVLWYRPGDGLSVDALVEIFSSVYLHGAIAESARQSWFPTEPFSDNESLLLSITSPPQFTLREGHAKLLDAACALFARKGYFATSMREIAELTGLQKATLYHYVTGKEDLIYQISKAALDHIQSGMEIALEGVSDPLERVHVFITTHVVCLLQHRNWHACANDELHALSAERRAEIVGLRDAYEYKLRAIFKEAQDSGSLRTDVAPKTLGLVVLGMINCIYPWYVPAKDLTPVKLGHVLSNLFLTGARA